MGRKRVPRREFLSALQAGIDLVQTELDRRTSGEPATGDVEDLRKILAELLQVQAKVSATAQPQPGRLGCVRYIVIDCWPMNDPLGAKLCHIDTMYEKLVGDAT